MSREFSNYNYSVFFQILNSLANENKSIFSLNSYRDSISLVKRWAYVADFFVIGTSDVYSSPDQLYYRTQEKLSKLEKDALNGTANIKLYDPLSVSVQDVLAKKEFLEAGMYNILFDYTPYLESDQFKNSVSSSGISNYLLILPKKEEIFVKNRPTSANFSINLVESRNY